MTESTRVKLQLASGMEIEAPLSIGRTDGHHLALEISDSRVL
jgi:hypothetical protein